MPARAALGDRLRDARPHRVGEAEEAEEPEPEVVLPAGEVAAGRSPPARRRGPCDPSPRAPRSGGRALRPPPPERWQRSAIASGAPLAAMTCSLRSGERQTRDIARSSRESGYSRRSSQSRWRCSVPASVRVAQLHASPSPSGRTGRRGWRGSRTRRARGSPPGAEVPPGSTARTSSPTASVGDRHPVHRQRAGLVDAERGRRAERLDGGHPAGQDLVLREPPRAQGEEDRQDDGELLGEHRHPEGQAREEPLQEVAPGEREDGDDRQRRARGR